MSALLIYSTKCQRCVDIIQYIQSKPQLANIIRYHDVNQLGIPGEYRDKIASVPVMITKDRKLLNGKQQIMTWVSSLLPCEVTHQTMGKGIGMSSLGGGDDGNHFNLSSYGEPLQPAMTPELEAKISKKVDAANSQYT